MPISQFAMLGTLLLSSFAPGMQLKLIGYLPADDDIAAMMHHWRYVGYLKSLELHSRGEGAQQQGAEHRELADWHAQARAGPIRRAAAGCCG